MDSMSPSPSPLSSYASLDEATTAHDRGTTLWSRVAGGALDLALRGAVATSQLRDAIAARRANARGAAPVVASIAIDRSPEQIYRFYRRPSQLPRVIDYLHSVREADETYSHWVAKLPGGGTLAWDAKITEDRPGELIAWRSVEGSLIDLHGRVTFARIPGGTMTEVRVEIQLGLGTRASARVATLFTRAQIASDLQRLKQLLESSDVLYADPSAAHRAVPPTASALAGNEPRLDGQLRVPRTRPVARAQRAR